MKTVWHWKNIFKSLATIVLVGAVCMSISYFMQLGYVSSLFIGAISGIVTAQICMAKWELYHFEYGGD